MCIWNLHWLWHWHLLCELSVASLHPLAMTSCLFRKEPIQSWDHSWIQSTVDKHLTTSTVHHIFIKYSPIQSRLFACSLSSNTLLETKLEGMKTQTESTLFLCKLMFANQNTIFCPPRFWVSPVVMAPGMLLGTTISGLRSDVRGFQKLYICSLRSKEWKQQRPPDDPRGCEDTLTAGRNAKNKWSYLTSAELGQREVVNHELEKRFTFEQHWAFQKDPKNAVGCKGLPR